MVAFLAGSEGETGPILPRVARRTGALTTHTGIGGSCIRADWTARGAARLGGFAGAGGADHDRFDGLRHDKQHGVGHHGVDPTHYFIVSAVDHHSTGNHDK